MNKWSIRYWDQKKEKSSIQRWLDKLGHEQIKSIAKELNILGNLGNELKLPHSRSLNKGLFELRERRYGYRIYYCFYKELIIVLLAAGDKESQQDDIKIARKRLQIIKEEGL